MTKKYPAFIIGELSKSSLALPSHMLHAFYSFKSEFHTAKQYLIFIKKQKFRQGIKMYHLAPTLLSLSIQERIVWPRPFSGRLPSLHGINIMSCSFYTVNVICPKNKINKNAIMKWTQPSRPVPCASSILIKPGVNRSLGLLKCLSMVP